MVLPRKRQNPRWTSEMFQVPASHEPKDPPEKRDCCKPKPKTLHVQLTRPAAPVQQQQEDVPAGIPMMERIALTCVSGDTPISDQPAPVEPAAEEPPSKRLKLMTETGEETDEDVDGLGFKDVWGSKKQMASPNSRRNKDMLWSLNW